MNQQSPIGRCIAALALLALLTSCTPQDTYKPPIKFRFMRAWFGISNYSIARNKNLPTSRLDENGKPLSSWRFQVVKFMEDRPFDDGKPYNIDAAWDSDANKHARDAWRPLEYCIEDPTNSGDTNIFAVAGPETAMDSGAVLWKELSEGDAKDLILAIEVADSKTHWMQPGDYKVADLLAAKGKVGDTLHGILPDRVHVLFADGRCWAISADAPISDLQPFLTITGAKSSDRAKLLQPHRLDTPLPSEKDDDGPK